MRERMGRRGEGACGAGAKRGARRAFGPVRRAGAAGEPAAFQELPRRCLTAEEYPIMIPDDDNANAISYGRLPSMWSETWLLSRGVQGRWTPRGICRLTTEGHESGESPLTMTYVAPAICMTRDGPLLPYRVWDVE